MTNKYVCRVCNSIDTECLGKLPTQTHFAGEFLEISIAESHLYKCNSCLLLVRHPILSEPEYNNLYSKAGTAFWSNDNLELRPDQRIVKNIILKNFKTPCRLLDVGCYTGDFLSSLPEDYIKYGVEMSKEASRISSERGIKIIGNDLHNIETNQKFDVIIAIDVIEHTANPEEFLEKLSSMLEAEGRMIISTGNSDNLLWRILKNNFWYSMYLEHISFIGARWLERFCQKNHFIIIDRHFFHYSASTIKGSLKNIVKAILSLLGGAPLRFSNSTRDHFCFTLKVRN